MATTLQADPNKVIYQSPLSTRYASQEMSHLFSAQRKHETWRHLWVTLARAERGLSLPITEAQIQELEDHVHDIDFALAEEYEKELQHDVMAHIHAYGEQCPTARPIIHLGATSCLITDNAEVLIFREALLLLHKRLIDLIEALAEKSDKYKELACLSFTHFQPAQPCTVGKRMALWLQDFHMDLEDLEYRTHHLRLLGIKGATGTQASFLDLFEGDHDKVNELETLMMQLLGFERVFPLSGQTYSRKQDAQILDVLGGIAMSAHKMATDFRLLAHMEEIEEPFGKKQVGSSAMPYKKNPMRCERVCSLARYLLSLVENPKYTAATQWMERTLDDSANRRLCIPEAFLAADAILLLLTHVAKHLEVYPKVIEKNLQRKLPFLATERILMECVKRGADRQTIHESLRQHCIEVTQSSKIDGVEMDLIQRLADDPAIPLNREDLHKLLDIKNFVGRAPQQVTEYLKLLRSV